MRLVLKLSGKVLERESLRRSLAQQIARLQELGYEMLLVHGGGRQLTDYCREQNIPVIQHQGRRITDEATLEAAKKVFGALNTQLTATLLSAGVKAIGINAFDGFLTNCFRRPPLEMPGVNGVESCSIDFGLVGEIESVDPSLINILWSGGCVPIINCLCRDASGQILNINADTLAAELALGLGADRLIAVTDVDGIYMDPADPNTRISSLGLDQARAYLDGGVFLDGMIPKVQNAIRIMERGLPSFQIVSGLPEDALLQGIQGLGGTLMYSRVQEPGNWKELSSQEPNPRPQK